MGVLKNTFLRELNKFNNGQYNNLILHSEVVMNEVDAPYGTHYGVNNVLSYLNTYQKARRPKLVVDPNTIVESPPSLRGATHGQVSGTDGAYQDNSLQQPPSTPFPVRYIFNFRKENNKWLLINATATRV
jgi:hypothetical protein